MDLNALIGYVFSWEVALLILVIVTLKKGIRFVPQNRAYVIERFGKYARTMEAGLGFTVPFIESLAYDRSLKEQAYDVPSQSAITKDNISLTVDGVLYFRVLDPKKASYGVDDYQFAVVQLAQTTMRSELGKIELDKTFEDRDALNGRIVAAINEASAAWGVQVLRYEIKDITPPSSVMNAMEQQMKAERERRAKILASEGDRQSTINVAEGHKQAQVLAAEGEKAEQVLQAQGEAEAIRELANAQAAALDIIGQKASTEEGQKAIQLELAKKAIEAKAAIAKESSVVLLPDNASDPSNVVSQTMAIIGALNNKDTPVV